MGDVRRLFENNLRWATSVREQNPDYFKRLSALQEPKYLWIGCSDSRVPANQITGLEPGEIFVHRNVGNVVVFSDLNFQSVLQFAVDVLKVQDILVVGHYGCGAVRAAVENQRMGLVDNWIGHIRDVKERHADHFSKDMSATAQYRRLCELNVIEQVRHVSQSLVMRDAWARDTDVAIHGWVYDLADGLLQDLQANITISKNADEVCAKAIDRLRGQKQS